MTIHEVSKLAGVSVRTLHHYDAIGLLPPTALTEAGYRLYDDTALARLQSILLFRELEFPLKDIKSIFADRHTLSSKCPADVAEVTLMLSRIEFIFSLHSLLGNRSSHINNPSKQFERQIVC